MVKTKTSVTLDDALLGWVDKEIEKKRFANRTHAIEFALQQLKDSKK
jgi:Arc/MetJ-type ribon-helix-helix transcriptional regulator